MPQSFVISRMSPERLRILASWTSGALIPSTHHRMSGSHFGSLKALCQDAHLGFDDTLDFIWKAPEFIALQEQIEQRKLEEECDDIRGFRWALESRKLYRVFPMLMATGNLFTSTSLFEIYLLQLAKVLEMRTGQPINGRNQGVTRYLDYLRSLRVDTSAPALWPQVNAALKIRNCLMHASGLLTDSRDRVDLQRIVSGKIYLSTRHRSRSVEEEGHMVAILHTPFGERLQITNYYAWLQTSYLRDYFLDICERAAAMTGEAFLLFGESGRSRGA